MVRISGTSFMWTDASVALSAHVAVEAQQPILVFRESLLFQPQVEVLAAPDLPEVLRPTATDVVYGQERKIRQS